MRDWEKQYDNPSTAHLIGWAYEFGDRLVLRVPKVVPELPPVVLLPGETTFVEHEVRRLAATLKARRKVLKLSQTGLGRLVGVGRSSLQRWEDGQDSPTALNLIMWATVLGYTLDLMHDPNW
ncbi:helix-turn-helix domain-containing protein [Catenulispora pinistramenti]|uniref:helix-turn-helix domain-containing protein n=1 Tax=Catenulispora pinistramenti TaxID=2705254 RepID=UPI001E3E61ED